MPKEREHAANETVTRWFVIAWIVIFGDVKIYKKESLMENPYRVVEHIFAFSQVIVIISHCLRE